REAMTCRGFRGKADLPGLGALAACKGEQQGDRRRRQIRHSARTFHLSWLHPERLLDVRQWGACEYARQIELHCRSSTSQAAATRTFSRQDLGYASPAVTCGVGLAMIRLYHLVTDTVSCHHTRFSKQSGRSCAEASCDHRRRRRSRPTSDPAPASYLDTLRSAVGNAGQQSWRKGSSCSSDSIRPSLAGAVGASSWDGIAGGRRCCPVFCCRRCAI